MKKHVLLIGGSTMTRPLSAMLIEKGHHVTVINDDIEICKTLSETKKLNVVNGDGSKPFILEEAGASKADLAVALSDNDSDNLVICLLCKKKFHIKKTVARISDPLKIEFFQSIGIDSVVCAASIISTVIEQQIYQN